MNNLHELIKIADIHAQRIARAKNKIAHLFPANAMIITKMTEDELVWIDLFVNRFSKLQDLLGAKIVDRFLQEINENVEALTMLDKVNKLERLSIISDQKLWKEMREARNHAAHEYPDDPALTAKYLNDVFELAPELLNILSNIKKMLASFNLI